MQDDVLANIEVTNYLQACGSVVLVVRTAGEHEKSRAETEIHVIMKASMYDIITIPFDLMSPGRELADEGGIPNKSQCPERRA